MWGNITKWDLDLKRGDLVRVDSTGGILLLASEDLSTDMQYDVIHTAVFLETRLIDFSVDKEECPIILHDGLIRIVIRGNVTRAE